jgi:prolipoprotein diacylglyceryl transferase
MTEFAYIIWAPNPDIFVIPGLDHPVRWYGLLFALGFILGQQIVFWMFRQEGKPEKHVEKLTVYMVVSTIIGARLGHCLFYDPDFYLSNPLEILKIWEGGLASHGGAIGIVFALYLFSRKYPYSLFWVLDRIVIVVALTGALIRVGNFMNSEMEGTETNSNFGVVYAGFTRDYVESDPDVDRVEFERNENLTSAQGRAPLVLKIIYKEGVPFNTQKKIAIEGKLRYGLQSYEEVVQHIDFGDGPLNYQVESESGREVVRIFGTGIVRHTGQLYETAYCLILMVLLFWFWRYKRDALPAGFNFALFMIVLWIARFFDEFFKMNQVDFEDDLVLNMGQLLSIPMAFIGVVVMVWIYKRKKRTMQEG